MTVFADPEAAQRSQERLQNLTDADLSAFWAVGFDGCADPDLALVNLERWLGATSSPSTNLALLGEAPRLSQGLVRIFGASQPLADTIIQNPELASLFLEPGLLDAPLSRDALLTEGRSLLASAYSYTHRLDRLRYLKQRSLLPLVLNDLYGRLAEEAVWTSLSDLADALVELSVEVCWNEYRQGKEQLPHRCPLMVVAFGKLGGRELNYSSDIDLVYVSPDETDEELEKHLVRFGEALTRAVSDRMGRGALYRVDLRLRPYGAAGALIRTMRGVETYYDTYAENWEVQALIRSRPVVGSDSLSQRWLQMVQRICFKPKVSDLAVEEMLAMRARTEAMAGDNDLKRGAGGIRDVEFLTQVLQIVHGYRHPSVRTPATLNALKALDRVHVLDHAVASALTGGYRFLRQLEHRCQLVADQQTHHIPEAGKAREHLARLMGMRDWAQLAEGIAFHRRSVRTMYESILHPPKDHADDRSAVARQLGKLAPAALQWFDVLPESEMFYRSLLENQDSLGRVRLVLSDAPTLVARFKKSIALTELLISGEIEEHSDPARRMSSLAAETPLEEVAATFENAWTSIAAQWVLEPRFEPGPLLSELIDETIRHCLRRIYAGFDVIALGSYGMEDSSFGSDSDLLFLIRDRTRHQEAETHAQQLLLMLDKLKRLGAPLEVDLRLRPMGREGLLVRTFEGLKAYELESMEMWERFALGQCRLVAGSQEALALVQQVAYALPLTPERVRELVAMKKRIETERVPAQYFRRNVKLGLGGLSDIEWFVHLHEMRFPGATGIESLRRFDPVQLPDVGGPTHRMDGRIRRLARAGLINAAERDQLIEARHHLIALRNRLVLLGYSHDVLPENPDRLDHLAEASGSPDGNTFLAFHEALIGTVRSIYSDGLERLKA